MNVIGCNVCIPTGNGQLANKAAYLFCALFTPVQQLFLYLAVLNRAVCLTITTINTLSPNASEMSVLSPAAWVQAAHPKKFRMKIPTNSANTAFQMLVDLPESSSMPSLYDVPILDGCFSLNYMVLQMPPCATGLFSNNTFSHSSCTFRKQLSPREKYFVTLQVPLTICYQNHYLEP